MLSAIQQFFTDLWDSLTQTMSNPDMAAELVQPISGLLQLLTPLLALFILIRCGRSLLRKIEEEVWEGLSGYSRPDRLSPPHWENLIGRSSRCDVVLNFPTVSRSHAALIRDNAGQWQLHPLNAKNGVLLNGAPITEPEPVQDGDLFDMGGLVLAFLPANEEELHAQAQRRTKQTLHLPWRDSVPADPVPRPPSASSCCCPIRARQTHRPSSPVLGCWQAPCGFYICCTAS